jgi:hypothetical protein
MHNNNNSYLPYLALPDSLAFFPTDRLSSMIKITDILYCDDTLDERVGNYMAQHRWSNADYRPVPMSIFRHVEISHKDNIVAYFEYDEDGSLKGHYLVYHIDLPYKMPPNSFYNYEIGRINENNGKLYMEINDGNICWKEAIRLARKKGIRGEFPGVSYWRQYFYDSIAHEYIDSYVISGYNKKYALIDAKTGKVLGQGYLKDTTLGNQTYSGMPSLSKYMKKH